MAGKTYREYWEEGAELEQRRLMELSVDQLLALVQARALGDYHTIWYVIAEKREVARTAEFMYGQLFSDLDDSQRYNCARALLSMLPHTGIRPEDVSFPGRPGYGLYTAELREAVEKAVAIVRDGASGAA